MAIPGDGVGGMGERASLMCLASYGGVTGGILAHWVMAGYHMSHMITCLHHWSCTHLVSRSACNLKTFDLLGAGIVYVVSSPLMDLRNHAYRISKYTVKRFIFQIFKINLHKKTHF